MHGCIYVYLRMHANAINAHSSCPLSKNIIIKCKVSSPDNYQIQTHIISRLGIFFYLLFCSKTPAPLNNTIVCPGFTFVSPITAENSRNWPDSM